MLTHKTEENCGGLKWHSMVPWIKNKSSPFFLTVLTLLPLFVLAHLSTEICTLNALATASKLTALPTAPCARMYIGAARLPLSRSQPNHSPLKIKSLMAFYKHQDKNGDGYDRSYPPKPGPTFASRTGPTFASRTWYDATCVPFWTLPWCTSCDNHLNFLARFS